MPARKLTVLDSAPHGTPVSPAVPPRWWERLLRRALPPVLTVAVVREGDADPVAPPRYHVVRRVSLRPGRDGLRLRQLEREIVRSDADAVLVGPGIAPRALREIAAFADKIGVALVYPAPGSPVRGERPNLVWAGDQPFFELGIRSVGDGMPPHKRGLDILAAAIGLTALAPLLALVAIGIRLDSPGPILFAQPRAGWHGRRFRMLKFRTMRHGADEEKIDLAHLNASGDRRLFKIPNDPRVTRFGRFLRRWSLDELPQLWNVLVGDMSLVGPRPFFESDLLDYEAHHFRRLTVKPGITGNWQVRGRSDILDFEEVVRLDREYIEQWSFGLDCRILLQTLPAVLRRTGAY